VSSVGHPAFDREAVAEPESLRDLAVARSIQKARDRAEHRTTVLIDAALDLVAERGSLEFTVQEVVARAQLSLHAFYQLFEGKDSLIEAVLEESLERGVLALRDLVEEETEPIDRLRAFVIGYFELATSSGQPMLGSGHAFRMLALHLSAVAPAKSWKTYRPLRVLAYELLRAAAAEHEVRSDLDIDRLAGFILLSVSAVTELAIDEPEQRWPDGEQLWQLIARGVTRGSP
jgi:AcrR family transcriptional regulator